MMVLALGVRYIVMNNTTFMKYLMLAWLFPYDSTGAIDPFPCRECTYIRRAAHQSLALMAVNQ
jgi:hypothetical protein